MRDQFGAVFGWYQDDSEGDNEKGYLNSHSLFDEEGWVLER
jgi:hypothetical protein